MIKKLKLEFPDVTQTCCTDNAGALGTFANVKLYFNSLKRFCLRYGYYPELSKRVLISHLENIVVGNGLACIMCLKCALACAIDGNYRVITLLFKKYGNLPLCLENYALFLLPLIFTNIFHTYPLMYIIYLGEPSGNFDFKLPWHIYTYIHAWILSYLSKEKFQTVFFHDSCKKVCLVGRHFFNSSPKFINK